MFHFLKISVYILTKICCTIVAILIRIALLFCLIWISFEIKMLSV